MPGGVTAAARPTAAAQSYAAKAWAEKRAAAVKKAEALKEQRRLAQLAREAAASGEKDGAPAAAVLSAPAPAPACPPEPPMSATGAPVPAPAPLRASDHPAKFECGDGSFEDSLGGDRSDRSSGPPTLRRAPGFQAQEQRRQQSRAERVDALPAAAPRPPVFPLPCRSAPLAEPPAPSPQAPPPKVSTAPSNSRTAPVPRPTTSPHLADLSAPGEAAALGGGRRRRWEMPSDGDLFLPMTGTPSSPTTGASPVAYARPPSQRGAVAPDAVGLSPEGVAAPMDEDDGATPDGTDEDCAEEDSGDGYEDACEDEDGGEWLEDEWVEGEAAEEAEEDEDGVEGEEGVDGSLYGSPGDLTERRVRGPTTPPPMHPAHATFGRAFPPPTPPSHSRVPRASLGRLAGGGGGFGAALAPAIAASRGVHDAPPPRSAAVAPAQLQPLTQSAPTPPQPPPQPARTATAGLQPPTASARSSSRLPSARQQLAGAPPPPPPQQQQPPSGPPTTGVPRGADSRRDSGRAAAAPPPNPPPPPPVAAPAPALAPAVLDIVAPGVHPGGVAANANSDAAQEARLAAIAAAGGNKKPVAAADDDPVTRQNMDKRQSRKVNRDSFVDAIEEWRLKNPPNPKDASGARVPLVPHTDPGAAEPRRRLRALVRKRPLFAHETARGEFDVVSVRGAGGIVVHNCCMQPDLKRMFLRHVMYSVSEAFDDDAETHEVCERGVHPLLANVHAGGCSTLFMYGQTGSGKTHTMAGIEQYASAVLLPLEPSFDEAGQPVAVGSLTFFEIAGTRCVELLGDAHGRELPLKQDGDGRVLPLGVCRVPIHSAAELLEHIATAKSRRATSATGANAVSSRSHAVCQLTLLAGAPQPAAAPLRGGGGKRSPGGRLPILTLVDCAGTERKEDSMWHDADRRKEGAEINQSLHALKECMRHWVLVQDGKTAHIPFRESVLTRVLQDSFVRSDTLISVIGTVSPSCTDTEHTLTTLKTVAAVAGTDHAIREVKRDVKAREVAPAPETLPPKVWDEARVRAWLADAISSRGEPLAALLPLLPAGTNGKQLMRMSAVQIKQHWGAPELLASAVFHELRVETKRAEANKANRVKGLRQAEQRRKSGVIG